MKGLLLQEKNCFTPLYLTMETMGLRPLFHETKKWKFIECGTPHTEGFRKMGYRKETLYDHFKNHFSWKKKDSLSKMLFL